MSVSREERKSNDLWQSMVPKIARAESVTHFSQSLMKEEERMIGTNSSSPPFEREFSSESSLEMTTNPANSLERIPTNITTEQMTDQTTEQLGNEQVVSPSSSSSSSSTTSPPSLAFALLKHPRFRPFSDFLKQLHGTIPQEHHKNFKHYVFYLLTGGLSAADFATVVTQVCKPNTTISAEIQKHLQDWTKRYMDTLKIVGELRFAEEEECKKKKAENELKEKLRRDVLERHRQQNSKSGGKRQQMKGKVVEEQNLGMSANMQDCKRAKVVAL
eukprot:m.51916 g.51916  ORF g.51916 m.51916 type:complete len:273 (-) comp10977_c1_seq1:441-1259(-)